MLRGWAGYFRLTQGKRALEALEGWVRHKLRCVLWRQWKQPSTRARNLMRLGLDEARALQISVQWTRPVVELGGVTHESGATEEAVGPTWTGLDTGHDKPA